MGGDLRLEPLQAGLRFIHPYMEAREAFLWVLRLELFSLPKTPQPKPHLNGIQSRI